jgi:wobble nucleotide-excising tRNase
MIESIRLASVATYSADGCELQNTKRVNFIYGSNGSGKTTLSKLLHDRSQYPTCTVKWNAGHQLPVLVYNREFVEKNFSDTKALKGIFTLGSIQVATEAEIERIKTELGTLRSQVNGFTVTLSGNENQKGKIGELAEIETSIKESCWRMKQKYDSDFQAAFSGLRADAEKFKARTLAELDNNASELKSYEDLKQLASKVFVKGMVSRNRIVKPSFEWTVDQNLAETLATPVVGANDVGISQLINKLNNSDWIKNGLTYLTEEEVCPFCQQELPEDLRQSLYDYFDETYKNRLKTIEDGLLAFRKEASKFIEGIELIVSDHSPDVNIELLSAQFDTCKQIFGQIEDSFQVKMGEPSRRVVLKDCSASVSNLLDTIQSANDKIDQHNDLFDDLANQKAQLTGQIWRFVAEEVKVETSKLRSDKVSVENAIRALNTKIAEGNSAESELKQKLSTLESSLVDSAQTIDAINGILARFNFNGFKLQSGPGSHSYMVVRPDGSHVEQTLSEGEKTFVTFLYFYYLVKGSQNQSEVSGPRVVVFDDPVSSLDSEILFIVSTLVKSLIEECRRQSPVSDIKQVFVLTHNIYFHKEVVFHPKRSASHAMSDEGFWILRKRNEVSTVTAYRENPIKTSYELLWAELRQCDGSSDVVPNIMRRILENYFKVLGGLDTDKLLDYFSGDERLVFRALISWINEGSHLVADDSYVAFDAAVADRFKHVFKTIFEISGHLGHYEMMMAQSPVVP